ncbi:MAG: beta-galactosidase [Clostridia bacterium]|nr:beta-galactosidase [Clostridia bacterium]
MGKFEVKDQFYLNGEPFRIISGGMHYFRVVPEYWRDRLEKLKAMGCNTVETYVAWNMHEPKEGEFVFDGICDLKKFIETAQELGLYVIVRPSPYICAEWEFGGLPAWLLKHDGIKLRGLYEPYMTYVKRYYEKLFEILAPLQITRGGPIIMFQIENEYGYYGDDTEYLKAMKDLMIENGAEVPFVTSDGPWGDAIESGKCPGALPTGNFGSNVKGQFDALRKYTDGGPVMVMEFWVGWFDNWGCGKHNTSNLEQNKLDFEDAIKLGNVNIYMFHGGTNFGFMNGSNYYDELSPDVTSYDYDAVLSEDGEITPKYEAFREIVAKYADVPEVPLSTKILKKDYGTLRCEGKVSLKNVIADISKPVHAHSTIAMEKLDQCYGYTYYETDFGKDKWLERLYLADANDRAVVMLDDEIETTIYDRELLAEKKINKSAQKLGILMENMGRVNYSWKIEKQQKGITNGVLVNGHFHYGWDSYPLPLDNIDKVDFSKGYEENTPAFYKFGFEADELGDTFIEPEGFGKGVVFVNGFNIGRFWEIGPQKRLYIPAPLLKKGHNEIVIFETDGKAKDEASLKAEPKLD